MGDVVEPLNPPVSAGRTGVSLWLPATMYVLLFLAGLFPVTMLGGMPYYPGPDEPLDVIVQFFRARRSAVLICAFLQFGAALALGICAAAIVARLRSFEVHSTGTEIASFGGVATAITMMASSSVQWVMSHPGIPDEPLLTQALYRLGFALGGPGFSAPFGIFVAGVTAAAFRLGLLPRWVRILGIVVALAGVSSWFHIVLPQALPLIPLTRFPGFVWMLAAALALSRAADARRET
jgi:hypothetical protein